MKWGGWWRAGDLGSGLRGAVVLAVLALPPALGSWWMHREDPAVRMAGVRVPSVPAAEAMDGRPVLWVDAREDAAFEAGHLPEAVSFNEGNWEAQISSLVFLWRPGVRVVVYGDRGQGPEVRRVAARILVAVGLPEVFVLRGDWRSAAGGAEAR